MLLLSIERENFIHHFFCNNNDFLIVMISHKVMTYDKFVLNPKKT